MNQMTTICDEPALRAFLGDPIPITVNKELREFDEPCRKFLSMTTILFISTMGKDGKADVSPRGDPPGFIKVLDGRTFAIPDRPGNRRADTMSNILNNPDASVGLIFLVPGIEETLRASGHARVSDDPKLLMLPEMAVNGKAPNLAVVVTIDEAFFHCAKALKRARLWDSSMCVDRKSFPSMATLMQARHPEENLEIVEGLVADNYKNELY